MVIMVAPGTVNPPPTSTATSPDGRLRATLDIARGGVWLDAAFPPSADQPEWVRFYRQDQPVIGGSPVWAVCGEATAFDHYAPVEGASFWRAEAIRRNGSVMAVSQPVGMASPGMDACAWLKSLENPTLSMRVHLLTPAHDIVDEARLQVSTPPGSARPTGTWDVRVEQTRTYRFKTENAGQHQQMRRLLDAGPLLIQLDPAMAEPDQWMIAGRSVQSYATDLPMHDPARWWTVDFQPWTEPDPEGQPTRAPGLLHRDRLGTTLRQLDQTYPGLRSH